MAEYLKNKQQLALNNENLNKILADLEGLPGGANLNIATQDGVLIGTLTKDTDGFYKMQPAEDPWAEIDAQAGLIEQAIKALENKFIEAGVKGIDIGQVTTTSDDFTVNHKLGIIPSVVIVYRTTMDQYSIALLYFGDSILLDSSTNEDYYGFIVSGGNSSEYIDQSGGIGPYDDGQIKKDANQIYLNYQRNSGQTYHWIAIA